MILPFALWLLLIALLPHSAPQWWARHYWKLSLALAAVTIGYYLMALRHEASAPLLHTGYDYLSFITLIGSLYVVSGGIHVKVPGDATPARNVCFLAAGGVLSNILGTTGASMLLIRPWLRMNSSRPAVHHVVFFIFVVANVGGGLTPIGDPPLLLGYLKGVPFWWVLQHCWMPWLFSMALLLGVFYYFDRHGHAPAIAEDRGQWAFSGGWNLIFLAAIVGAVFIPQPILLREAVMLAAAVASYFMTPPEIHESNHFDFEPIIEVAVLFFGIFATMMPAMDWLGAHAQSFLGHNLSPARIFWRSGGVSSVLDNAPAYLAFASSLTGVFGGAPQAGNLNLLPLARSGSAYLAALSVATVFFGAMTYIGNGPNLMIKAVAQRQKIVLPSFLGYVVHWAVPILLPVLVILQIIFVR
jgi:Na+/H+ antiporter NhaD/arsenite permease-like protein